MMIIVVFIFGACWLPQHVYFIIAFVDKSLSHQPYIQHIYLIIYWVAMSNSMYNAFIYCWMNSRYVQCSEPFHVYTTPYAELVNVAQLVPACIGWIQGVYSALNNFMYIIMYINAVLAGTLGTYVECTKHSMYTALLPMRSGLNFLCVVNTCTSRYLLLLVYFTASRLGEKSHLDCSKLYQDLSLWYVQHLMIMTLKVIWTLPFIMI
jgi:hypothetical protein